MKMFINYNLHITVFDLNTILVCLHTVCISLLTEVLEISICISLLFSLNTIYRLLLKCGLTDFLIKLFQS